MLVCQSVKRRKPGSLTLNTSFVDLAILPYENFFCLLIKSMCSPLAVDVYANCTFQMDSRWGGKTPRDVMRCCWWKFWPSTWHATKKCWFLKHQQYRYLFTIMNWHNSLFLKACFCDSFCPGLLEIQYNSSRRHEEIRNGKKTGVFLGVVAGWP